MRATHALLLLAAVLGTTPGRADDGRYQDYAVGARAMGLGGAFGAISDDATGVFYNPAGIVDVRRARISISTSLYGLELNGATPVESAFLKLQRGVSVTDLIIVPSSTGGVTGVGEPLPNGAFRQAWAFATLVPSYTSRFTETKPTNDDKTTFRSVLTDRTLHAGAAWALRVGPWLRIGAAAHYVLRTVDAEESLVTDRDGSDLLLTTTRLRAGTQSVRGCVGMKLWPGPRFSIGLTLTSPSLSVWQDTLFEATSVTADPKTGAAVLSVPRYESNGLVLQSQLPGQARVGFAYIEPGNLTLAMDVIGYLPSSYDLVPLNDPRLQELDPDRIPIPLHIERGPLINVAMGVEKLVTDDLSVAVGLFTNFTSAPELHLERGGTLAADSSRLSRVEMLGGSFAVGFFGEHSLSRLGITGSTGFGPTVVPQAPDARFGQGAPPLRSVNAVQTFVYVFWSSTFRFGDDQHAGRDFSL